MIRTFCLFIVTPCLTACAAGFSSTPAVTPAAVAPTGGVP